MNAFMHIIGFYNMSILKCINIALPKLYHELHN